MDPAYVSGLVTAFAVSGEVLTSDVNGHSVRIPRLGQSPVVITAAPTSGRIVMLPAAEPLARTGNTFQSGPNQSLGAVGLHSMVEVLSSMIYR